MISRVDEKELLSAAASSLTQPDLMVAQICQRVHRTKFWCPFAKIFRTAPRFLLRIPRTLHVCKTHKKGSRFIQAPI